MNLECELSKAYLDYFKSQVGGQLPFFVGQDQDGEGFGDFIKTIAGKVLHFIFPFLRGAVNGFADASSKGLSEGKNFKEVMKESIQPGISGAISGAVET